MPFRHSQRIQNSLVTLQDLIQRTFSRPKNNTKTYVDPIVLCLEWLKYTQSPKRNMFFFFLGGGEVGMHL